MMLVIQGLETARDIADTTSREVTIIGLLVLINAIIGFLWHRREVNWERKYDKLQDEKDEVINELHDELKDEIRSHSAEMKRAHESAVLMGERAMTIMEIKKTIREQ